MMDKSHLVWASMSSKKILATRKEMADYLRGKVEEGALENYGTGRVCDPLLPLIVNSNPDGDSLSTAHVLLAPS